MRFFKKKVYKPLATKYALKKSHKLFGSMFLGKVTIHLREENLSTMLLKEWGEDNFVEHLKKHFPVKGPIVGIGDDCAVIPSGQEKVWLVTIDALTEGVHFLKEHISARDLGYKTVAVNVSDIAAMGGTPKYAFLSIAIPKEMDCEWLHHLIEGVKESCKEWKTLLLGGDTIGSKRDLFLSLTLIGSASQNHVKYRHQAKPGDIICVTGFLGDSGGGLKALQEKKKATAHIKSLLQAHYRPQPSPSQGIWLASQEGVHAMMDISDGLDCDLKRLLKSSQKGAFIEITDLPISAALAQTSLENGWDTLQLALTGGEDYCLLTTISSSCFKTVQSKFHKKFKTPLFPIGHITEDPSRLEYYRYGEALNINYKNFDHFE